MANSIIIIGAGIAGLAAGCYARMNDYETTIFELHSLPGGLCTSWKRGGYTFDGCIHWLGGSSPSSSFHHVWSELGALQGCEIVNQEEFFRIEGQQGQTFIMYANADRLESHLKNLAPEDTETIEELTTAIKHLSDMEIPLADGAPGNVSARQKTELLSRYFRKYDRVTISDFAQRFKNPFLRESFASIFNMPYFPLVVLLITLGSKHRKAAGYPMGGSLEFAKSIEQRYLGLGGKIRYRARVAEIITEGNKAVGVRLSDGTEQRADIIISAADGHATIFDMLHGQFIDQEILSNYGSLPIFQPIIQVSLGINRDFGGEPHSLTFPVPDPLLIAGEPRSTISMKHYCYDPSMAPPGKSSIVVTFTSSYDFWQKLGAGSEAYQAEKDQIIAQVVSALERRFPGTKDKIEVSDVATPFTYERYTGNWQGSMEGWLITTNTLGKRMSPTLPGLKSFYMIGQWVHPGGGLPPAAKSGRDIIRTICEAEGKKFCTTVGSL